MGARNVTCVQSGDDISYCSRGIRERSKRVLGFRIRIGVSLSALVPYQLNRCTTPDSPLARQSPVANLYRLHAADDTPVVLRR
jgi:hypothetical protein